MMLPARGAWLVVVALAFAAPLGAQSPNPFSPLETAVPDGVGRPLGFGDVNGDGYPDLIVTGPPYVLLNDGHGRFTPATGSAGYSGPSVPRVIIADFNMDGHADLMTANGTNVVSLWFGTPSGALVAGPQPPALPGQVMSIAAGDVNGDGFPDVVYGSVIPVGGMIGSVAAATIVHINNGAGVFTAAGSLGLPATGTSGMAFLDVDLDGDQDLAVSGVGLAAGTMFNNLGTFTGTVQGGNTSSGTTMLVRRFNGDAYPDVIEYRLGDFPVISLGGPSGFTASFTTLPYVSQSLAAFDVNGDGIDEVFIADPYGISIYSIGAPGSAPLLARIDRTGGPMVSADVDGDGDVDLLVYADASYRESFSDGAGGLHYQGSGYEPRVLLGGPVPIDLNGDGAPELVGTVRLSTGTTALAVAQNDGTGRFSWTDVVPAGQALPYKQSLVVAADIDGNGQKDLVLVELTYVSQTAWSFGTRVVMRGAPGVWTAGPATTISSGGRCDAVAADMNNDGLEDLVYSDSSSGVRILYSNGAALVTPGVNISVAPANRIALFDADNDGDLDVAVAGQPSRLLVNMGGGVFVQDPAFPGQCAMFVTTQDLNGDGVADVWLNNSAYLHTGATWTAIGNVPASAALGENRSFDFDGDGDIDTVSGHGIAYVFEAPGVISVHGLATSPPYSGSRITPVDLDRDGDKDLVLTQPIDLPQNMGPVPWAPVVLYDTARQLSQDSPARPGRPLNLTLRGYPGQSWLLYAAPAPAIVPFPPFGTVFIDPASAFFLGQGTLSTADGSATVSIPVPPSASALLGTVFEVQGLVGTVGGSFLTNARHVKIVAF